MPTCTNKLFEKVYGKVGRCRRGGNLLSLKTGSRPSDLPINYFFECRDIADDDCAYHCEDALREHIGAVIEEGIEVGIHIDRRPDRAARDVMADETRENCQKYADYDAIIALALEKSGDSERGERDDVVGENADDQDERRESPREHLA